MNNFGIGNKHGYIRLSSDSSMNATVSDISHTKALSDQLASVKIVPLLIINQIILRWKTMDVVIGIMVRIQ